VQLLLRDNQVGVLEFKDLGTCRHPGGAVALGRNGK